MSNSITPPALGITPPALAVTPPALAGAWRGLDADPAGARRVAEAWLAATPADAGLLMAAAERRLGQVTTARARLAPRMTRRQKSPVAWFEWAMILVDSDAWEDAAAALLRAVALQPGFVGGWRALGDVRTLLREYALANEAYARATAASVIAAGGSAAHLLPAARALNMPDAAAAERLLKPLLRVNEADLPANLLLAEAAILLGYKAGIPRSVLEHCLNLAPHSAAGRHRLAALLYQFGGFRECIPELRSLLGVLPHQPILRIMLAESLSHIGDYAAAEPVYRALLEACPDRPRVGYGYAHVLSALGREGEAAAAYRAYLKQAGNTSGRVWLSLTDLRTMPVSEADIAAMRARLADPAETDIAQLNLALGRALEQRGEHEAAITHYVRGAAQRRTEVKYDADATTAAVAAARAVYTKAFFAARAGAGCASDAPIFIVGMPRSGSTLVEQILASHPSVEGTAELVELGLIVKELRGERAPAELPGVLAGLDMAEFGRLGERYIGETLQYRGSFRQRFTDKMPDNFLHTALIRLMLPNARVIDVRRHPMACGLAAFRQWFNINQGQNYTWDLREIGRYTRDYVALMDHFDEVLPGFVYHLRYEALVEDTEAQVRALLDYCGLPFDAACLRYWETERAVQTPSAQQVRRPIFREALDEWRKYEAWLGPLREALGDLAA